MEPRKVEDMPSKSMPTKPEYAGQDKKKGPLWKSQVFWTALAVIISSLAAGFTGYATYQVSLSSFHLRIGAGNPAFTTCNDKEKGTYSLCPIIPIEFINTGAKAGMVKDVVLVMSAGQWKSVLQPVAFPKSFGQEALSENGREAFHPFALNARERLFRNLLFYPGADPEESNPLQMRRDQSLSVGSYRFEVYVSTDTDTELELAFADTYYVPKDVVDGLTGTGPMFIPTGESVVHARRVLKEKLSGETSGAVRK